MCQLLAQKALFDPFAVVLPLPGAKSRHAHCQRSSQLREMRSRGPSESVCQRCPANPPAPWSRRKLIHQACSEYIQGAVAFGVARKSLAHVLSMLPILLELAATLPCKARTGKFDLHDHCQLKKDITIASFPSMASVKPWISW